MLPEEAIFRRVTGSTALNTLIGGRFLPLSASMRTTMPFVVYKRFTADHQHHLGGASGLVFLRMQFDIFGQTYAVVKAIGEAFRNLLDGYRGTVTNGPDSVLLSCVELQDEREDYVQPTDGTDIGAYRLTQDFRISASTSIPALV